MTASAAGGEKIDLTTVDDRAPDVAALFRRRVAATPEREAFRYPAGDAWQSVSWGDVGGRVDRLAAGLIALGVNAEDRVAVASATRYEWILADLAVMCAGGATTTVYPTTTAPDVAYIVADSQSRVVFADNDEQVAKIRQHRSELPDLLTVVVIDGTTADGDWVITFSELEDLGARLLSEHPESVAERIGAITPDSLATVIYTSGTTGRPKGVRLRHSCWTYEGAAVEAVDVLNADDLQFLWLPLAHVFGKLLIVLPLQIGFATAVDGRVDMIVDNLASVRPTFMAAAPRIFEKAYARVTAVIAEEGGLKTRIFSWAIGVGTKVAAARREHRSVSPLLAAQLVIADKVVLTKVRARFGGRLRFFASGSAALNREIAEWFDAIGITILEGYGLTETSAASFSNRPDAYEFGTVGLPYPGTEVKIAEDGEILLRGPGVMEGYHNLPEATAAALSVDGWMHTGDIGQLDDTGFLRITDRKKDLFKTSGGKYVAPSAIESLFKGICPLASQLVVYGENRNFVSALITIDPDAAAAWAQPKGMQAASYSDIVTSDSMRTTVQAYVDELNARLNPWERVQKFVILDRDLSIEAGELTPSMKLKRRVVADKFAGELDELYR